MHADSSHPLQTLTVGSTESGSKLLRFLERRLEESQKGQLHKWIRTGQVRVNKGRAKPFQIVETGDCIRIPPFALLRHIEENQRSRQTDKNTSSPHAASDTQAILAQKMPETGLPLVHQNEHFCILHKPAGLAVQGGSNQTDSVVDRLKETFQLLPFIPSPVHRLDKETSGLIVVATSQAGANAISAAFTHPLEVKKEYLAVCTGLCPWNNTYILYDSIQKQVDNKGNDSLRCKAPSGEIPLSFNREEAKVTIQEFLKQQLACLLCTPVATLTISNGTSPQPATLLHIRLLTGKKHQIRLQLASRKLPVVGDNKYKGIPHHPMLLHAYGVHWGTDVSCRALPAWPTSIMKQLAPALTHITEPFL